MLDAEAAVDVVFPDEVQPAARYAAVAVWSEPVYLAGPSMVCLLPGCHPPQEHELLSV